MHNHTGKESGTTLHSGVKVVPVYLDTWGCQGSIDVKGTPSGRPRFWILASLGGGGQIERLDKGVGRRKGMGERRGWWEEWEVEGWGVKGAARWRIAKGGDQEGEKEMEGVEGRSEERRER